MAQNSILTCNEGSNRVTECSGDERLEPTSNAGNFDFDLMLRNTYVNDSGMYVLKVEVVEDETPVNSIRVFNKSFYVNITGKKEVACTCTICMYMRTIILAHTVHMHTHAHTERPVTTSAVTTGRSCKLCKRTLFPLFYAVLYACLDGPATVETTGTIESPQTDRKYYYFACP